MDRPLNWNSRNLTQGWQRGVTAFYYGLKFQEDDFHKPQVGIGVPLLEGNLCNVHAYRLATLIKEGLAKEGLIGFPFGTPAVSDNITQGQEGGNASLPSRNMIANAAECVTSAHGYDFLIGMHNCDKNGPGFAMALARLNYPGLIINGGSIKPGCHRGQDTSILDVYDSQAAASVGAMTHDEADEILRTACPGAGGCGIAASFNTWGIALEAMGLTPPYSSSNPAEDPSKIAECENIGPMVRHLLAEDIRPRDIITRTSMINAARAVAAMGGSTNGVLHLLALAREAHVDFHLQDIQTICRETPVLCSFAPRGKRTMFDLFKLGGTPVFLKYLLQQGVIDGNCMTVTGKTMAENLADAPDVTWDQDLMVPIDKPFKPYADMQICFGNLAPGGIVFKVSSMKEPTFRGKAMCFEDPRKIVEAVERDEIQPGTVIVLRYLGPVASGMPEVLVATAALAVPKLDGKVAFISDTRVSGVSHGAIGVHCAPEAAVGGPIALVNDGDEISFDLVQGNLTLHVDDADLAARRREWQAPEIPRTRGYLADFAATVSQANHGCVSRALLPVEDE